MFDEGPWHIPHSQNLFQFRGGGRAVLGRGCAAGVSLMLGR
jgi:hypothetical protein